MANEVMFNLKYGIFSRLPEAKTPGTVYVTADEKAMYVDLPQVNGVDGTTIAPDRIRISQIIIKDSARDAQPPFSPDAFYYFVQENALLKWIPAKGETPAAWKQINSVSDVTANLEALERRVEANETAIGTLRTDKLDKSVYDGKVAEIDDKFTTINNTIGVPAADGQAATGLHADIAANETAIAGLTTKIGDDNNGMVKDIAVNTTAIAGLTTKIGTAEQNITNLTDLVGTLPEGTAQDNVVDFVIAQMEAADAMLYKGGIGAYTDLPTTGVEAGHTYVITADFTYNGESYYAGDLVVATADQGTAETYAGGWTHVKTGYQASQEAKLTGAANAIKLTSYTGVDLGTINVVAEDGGALTATVADNTLTLGIQWGSF